MWAPTDFGSLPEQGEDVREEEGQERKAKGCSPLPVRLPKLYQAPLCHQMCPAPMAEGEPGGGDGWRGNVLSILWPSLSGLVKEQQGRGGQQGSGSASACSGSRLPPALSPSPPLHPSVCVAAQQ